MKPFAESCEQNKHVIFEVIEKHFSGCQNILEVGSGTGQHAVFFASKLPHLLWQPSEQAENISGILQWLEDYPSNNIQSPITLNVNETWPANAYDGVFSANTAHIMSWQEVICFFKGVGESLESGGTFCLYGPFNYNKNFTSESNARFDQWLKDQSPLRGIRDFEELNSLAENQGLNFKEDVEMPANNRILVWQKI